MKPMLASAARSGDLRFPMLVSPKLDGVRCLIINGVAMSRSLKPIPNKYVQKLFGKKTLNGLDGELIVGDPTDKDTYRNTTSGVMSVDGTPDVIFWVFDDFSFMDDPELGMPPFHVRLAKARRRLGQCSEVVEWVEHFLVKDVDALFEMEEDYLKEGYEGLMLRDPEGPYKEGRSTESEGWLLKLKRFTDAEGEVVGTYQFMSNKNEAKRNKLGQLERSSHKENKVPEEKLGALRLKDLKTGTEFDIGSGFTEAERVRLWNLRHLLLGKIVKYKYQPTGVKDKPRFPVFMGFRSKEDM